MKNSEFWTQRYLEGKMGWDIGFPSTPLKAYIDQIQDKALKILIPGAGNAYEAAYLWDLGFHNSHIIDISSVPLNNFKAKNPDFPIQNIHHGDFFDFNERFDLILEQTFFCSFFPSPANRNRYAQKMIDLLNPKGKLVGVWFSFPLFTPPTKPPYGGSLKEYTKYFKSLFEIKTFETCYNSIPPRQGQELFAIMAKKNEPTL